MDQTGIFREFASITDSCYVKIGIWEITDSQTIRLIVIPGEGKASTTVLVAFIPNDNTLTIDGQQWKRIATKTPLWNEWEYHCWDQ